MNFSAQSDRLLRLLSRHWWSIRPCTQSSRRDQKRTNRSLIPVFMVSMKNLLLRFPVKRMNMHLKITLAAVGFAIAMTIGTVRADDYTITRNGDESLNMHKKDWTDSFWKGVAEGNRKQDEQNESYRILPITPVAQPITLDAKVINAHYGSDADTNSLVVRGTVTNTNGFAARFQYPNRALTLVGYNNDKQAVSSKDLELKFLSPGESMTFTALLADPKHEIRFTKVNRGNAYQEAAPAVEDTK
jgi:hypothetical protein